MKYDLKIRICTAEDAELLSEIGSETFWDTYGESPILNKNDISAYVKRAYDPERLRTELIDEGFRYLIAVADDETAGYARLKIGSPIENVESERPLEISRIYIRRKFQGCGMGKELIGRCIEEAERFLCDAVWLGVWQYNEKAIGFYERMGFKSSGTMEFDLAGNLQTDIVMALFPESEAG